MIGKGDTATVYAMRVSVGPEYRRAALYPHVVHNISRLRKYDDRRILMSAVPVPKNVGGSDVIASRDFNRNIVAEILSNLGLGLRLAAYKSKGYGDRSDASHRSNETQDQRPLATARVAAG
jgi:hypothetical protein